MLVTLAVDNLASEGLRSEHGLSFLVETGDGSVLFDTGQSDAWLHNLITLGREPKEIKAVTISHGHYDHTGGLAAAFRELPDAVYFAHPACFEPKYARSTEEARYIGMPVDIVSRKSAFTLNKSAIEVLPDTTLSGEVPYRTDMTLNSRFVIKDNEFRQDTFVDEQCLIVRNGNSTAVIVGCAHRGLENNIFAAINAGGVTRIDLLAGGFHLGSASEDRLESLAGFLENMDIGQIACCHCTGIGTYKYLRSRLGPRVTRARVGMSWQV